MYCYVWSFVVRPEHLDEFRAAYGPDGDWARLFRQDPAYLRTELLRDRDNPSRFLTIDFWSSYHACVSFRERFSSRFAALDRSFERFTIEEVKIGGFDTSGERG